MRRAEEPLERTGKSRLLQGGEDPAAVVVDHDQAQVGPRLTRPEGQAGRVVQEGQVPDQGERRAAVSQRGSDRRRHRTVDPAGPPAGHDADVSAGYGMKINIPNGHTARGPQKCVFRQPEDQVPGQARFGQPVLPVEDGVHRVAGRAVGPEPRVQPGLRPGWRASEPESRGDVGGGPLRVRPVSRPLPDDDMPADRSGQEDRLGPGKPWPPGRHDDIGAIRPDEFRRREQVLVRGQRVRPVPGPGRRLREHRPARLLGQLNQRRRVIVAVAADHHAAFGPGQLELARGGARRLEARPRLSVCAPAQRLRPVPGRGLVGPGGRPPGTPRGGQVGGERVAEGQVQVDRARPAGQAARAAGGISPGLAGQRPPVCGRPGAPFGHAGLAEPAHRAAVQLDLVDRLVGAGAPELGRPVGGKDQQRDRGLTRPRSRPGGSWPPPCPRYTAPPPAAGWPWPGRGR